MFVADSASPRRPQACEARERRGLAGLPLELIERETEALAARISAGSARWLELLGEFDRRQGWRLGLSLDLGMGGLAPWADPALGARAVRIIGA